MVNTLRKSRSTQIANFTPFTTILWSSSSNSVALYSRWCALVYACSTFSGRERTVDEGLGKGFDSLKAFFRKEAEESMFVEGVNDDPQEGGNGAPAPLEQDQREDGVRRWDDARCRLGGGAVRQGDLGFAFDVMSWRIDFSVLWIGMTMIVLFVVCGKVWMFCTLQYIRVKYTNTSIWSERDLDWGTESSVRYRQVG